MTCSLRLGFVACLQEAFDQVPDLFCATAQIFFPEGQRREETGKAVWKREKLSDFPVRCDLPLPGEKPELRALWQWRLLFIRYGKAEVSGRFE